MASSLVMNNPIHLTELALNLLPSQQCYYLRNIIYDYLLLSQPRYTIFNFLALPLCVSGTQVESLRTFWWSWFIGLVWSVLYKISNQDYLKKKRTNNCLSHQKRLVRTHLEQDSNLPQKEPEIRGRTFCLKATCNQDVVKILYLSFEPWLGVAVWFGAATEMRTVTECNCSLSSKEVIS